MQEMDDADAQEDGNQPENSTRTVTHVPSTTDGDASSFEIQDPDVVNTKGRPRMMTIKEAIKQNKFYKCSHCGSTKHTIKNCTNRDIHYDLPRRKRNTPNPRSQKKSDGGKKSKAKQPANGDSPGVKGKRSKPKQPSNGESVSATNKANVGKKRKAKEPVNGHNVAASSVVKGNKKMKLKGPIVAYDSITVNVVEPHAEEVVQKM